MFRIFVHQLVQCNSVVLPIASTSAATQKIVTNVWQFRSYRVPTSPEPNIQTQKSVAELRKMFKCTERSAQKFLWKIKTLDLKSFKKNFGFLSKQGATLPVLMENVKILNMPPDKLQDNFKLLDLLPWKKCEDFVPLLAIDRTIVKARNIVNLSERIYYLSEKLQVKPSIVSKYAINHKFMFALKFDRIKHKLDILLRYKEYIPSNNILRDLHILERSEESIMERMYQIISMSEVKKVMPWMLKCHKPTYDRSLEIRRDRGETLNYLAKRLDWDSKTTEEVERIFPQSVNFVKHFQCMENNLNFLLTLFSPESITHNIRLIMMNHDIVKRRYRTVRDAGVPLRNVEPNILIHRQAFLRFIKSYRTERQSRSQKPKSFC